MKRFPITAAVVATIFTFAALPLSAESFAGPYLGAELATEDFGSVEGTTTTLVGGWDFTVGPKWRLGVGLRWTVEDIDERRTEALGANVQDISVSIENRRGLSARRGRVFGDRWMAFAELGYETYDVDAVRVLRAPVCAPPTNCVISRLDGSFDESMTSLGVGVEWAVTEHARLRATFSRGESDAFDRDRLSVSASWAF